MPTPSIVQHNSGAGGAVAAGGTLSVTLNMAPTVGNLLVAAVQFSTGTGQFSAPDAYWTQLDSVQYGATWSRVVQSGDGTTFAFTNGSSAQNYAFEIYEVSGQGASAINQHAMASFSSPTTTASVTTAASTVANCLALAFFGTSTTAASPTPQSGWTQDENPNTASRFTGESQHSATAAAASGTAVTGSVTWSASSVRCTAAVVLIAPASGGGTTYTESFAITGSGTVVLHNRIGKPFAMTGSGTAALTKRIGKPFSAVGSGSVSLVRRIQKVIAVTGSGIVGLRRNIAKAFAFTGSGAVTATLIRVKMLTFAIVGSGSVQLKRRIGKTIAVQGSGAVTLGRHITKAFAVVGGGAVRLTKRIAKAFSASGSGIVSAVVRKLGSVTLPPVNITVTFLSKVPVTVSFVSKAVITAAYKTKAIITAIFD